MLRHGLSVAGLVLVLVCSASGCGSSENEAQDELDSIFPELTETTPEEVEDTTQQAISSPQVSVGERFAFVKTTEQTLLQELPDGPERSTSRLQLFLELTVEEIRGEEIRLGVHYESVSYSHQIAGETVDYDSTQAQPSIPDVAQVFQGLVHNGFSFWVGADNTVRELVGFEDFLRRCVSNLPVHDQRSMLAHLAAVQATEGVASLLDESICLLPFSAGDSERSVKEGQSWTQQRKLIEPLPMNLDTKYTLKSQDEMTAEIEVLGTIVPATAGSHGLRQLESAHQTLTLRDGHTFGNCEIDRRSGLPVRSQVTHRLSMAARLPDGNEMRQQKEIVTTLRAVQPVEHTEMLSHANDYQDPTDAGVMRAGAVEESYGGGSRITNAAYERERSQSAARESFR